MCTERTPRRRSRGITLLELIVAIVIIGVGLAGVLAVLNRAVQQSADPFPVKQAIAVAEGMIEEVALKNFANPVPGGWSGGATQANRQFFDDIGDYNGYDTGAGGGVWTVNGAAPLPGLAGYRVRVAVVNPSPLNGVAAALITVTVDDATGQAYTLSTYRTDY